MALRPLLRLPTRRLFTSYTPRYYPGAFNTGPAPPRLPKEDQDLFERLQRSSTGAFSTPRPDVVLNPAVDPSSSLSTTPSTSASPSTSSRPQINQSPDISEPETLETPNARVEASGQGDELHPDVRRGAKPEFEGDRNPKTGEVGGPKNEPLRWGGAGDWSYNGRVTDF
ncbi:MAG: putative mitochondrial protein, conserved [Caeruleum heppii]|nr:MAG: putative mitochondrial protein, conserved [Caeruleum heppii]